MKKSRDIAAGHHALFVPLSRCSISQATAKTYGMQVAVLHSGLLKQTAGTDIVSSSSSLFMMSLSLYDYSTFGAT